MFLVLWKIETVQLNELFSNIVYTCLIEKFVAVQQN